MSVKTGEISLNFILPEMPHYQPNWVEICKSMGINTLRINDGAYGQVGVNPLMNPDNWHVKLERILNLIDANGFRCYWNWLGDEYGCEFGIYDMQLGMPGRPLTLDVAAAKAIIDKLSNYGFLTDRRISHWVVGNECDITNPQTLSCLIELSDYMRGKGAKTAAGDYSYDWDNSTSRIIPVIKDHFDYMEIHQYGTYQLMHDFNLGNGVFDWEAFRLWLTRYWSNQFAYSEGIPLYLGEFGLELGPSLESQGMNATAEDRINYFNTYFSVTKPLDLKWISFHSVFPAGSVSTQNWGLIDLNGKRTPGANEVAAYYGGYVPVEPHTVIDEKYYDFGLWETFKRTQKNGAVTYWARNSETKVITPEFATVDELLVYIKPVVPPEPSTYAARVPMVGNSRLVQIYLRKLRNKLISKKLHKRLHPLV
jgi:hypothetical protein